MASRRQQLLPDHIEIPQAPTSARLPGMYEGLTDEELSQFMDDSLYQKIMAAPRLVVAPFCSQANSEAETSFGMGVSLVLIRHLMLVKDISVCAAEDTPEFTCEQIAINWGTLTERADFVAAGTAKHDGVKFEINLNLHTSPSNPLQLHLEDTSLPRLLERVAEAIAKGIGGTVTAETQQRWRHARPSSEDAVRRLGELQIDYAPGDPERHQRALALSRHEANMALPAHYFDWDEVDDPRQVVLAELEKDPYDVQLCYHAARALWSGLDNQPEVMQLLRRALELSPGYGAAHRYAVFAAHPGVDASRHQVVAGRLLADDVDRFGAAMGYDASMTPGYETSSNYTGRRPSSGWSSGTIIVIISVALTVIKLLMRLANN